MMHVERMARGGAMLAALAAMGGCWWHDSDVPAIEEADRARRSPLRDGVYCDVAADAPRLALESDCARLAWDRAERRLRATEINGEGEEGDAAWLDVAPLSSGLTVLQYDEAQEGGEHSYTLLAIVARQEGYAAVPLPMPRVREAIAGEEGVTLERSSDYGRILAGEPSAVRRLIERSAIAWLEAEPPPEMDKLGPFDPNSDDEIVPPRYVVRVEALDDDLEESAAIEKAVARLRAELERSAQGVE
jgi:hypothetical protein